MVVPAEPVRDLGPGDPASPTAVVGDDLPVTPPEGPSGNGCRIDDHALVVDLEPEAGFRQFHVDQVHRRVGWQPSRFLSDRGEAERAFALAERLGSINAAAAELGTTWPSLRKPFTRHGLGMPARNPEAVRQRAIEAAHQRSGRPATPSLDPVFVALNHGQLPVRARSGGELAERVRRAEDYAALGARVVVELHTESHAATPSTRAWAITRRAQRAHHRQADRTSRPKPEERGMVADAR